MMFKRSLRHVHQGSGPSRAIPRSLRELRQCVRNGRSAIGSISDGPFSHLSSLDPSGPSWDTPRLHLKSHARAVARDLSHRSNVIAKPLAERPSLPIKLLFFHHSSDFSLADYLDNSYKPLSRPARCPGTLPHGCGDDPMNATRQGLRRILKDLVPGLPHARGDEPKGAGGFGQRRRRVLLRSFPHVSGDEPTIAMGHGPVRFKVNLRSFPHISGDDPKIGSARDKVVSPLRPSIPPRARGRRRGAVPHQAPRLSFIQKTGGEKHLSPGASVRQITREGEVRDARFVGSRRGRERNPTNRR